MVIERVAIVLGDLLVMALIYFVLRSGGRFTVLKAAGLALGLGFLAEGLQYLHLADLLRLSPHDALYILLGNTFSPLDLVMYALGAGLSAAGDLYLLTPLHERWLKR